MYYSYMAEPTSPLKALGPPPRGITQSDVSHAADSLLRSGDRPTIEKVRAKIGNGSPNTINPLLDAWWKTLSARLDSGPAALHRLPESVAHVAEALWMQALEEGRRRAHRNKTSERLASTKTEPRGPLPRPDVARRRTRLPPARSRPHHRRPKSAPARTHRLLRKEQATRESLSRQIAELQPTRVSDRKSRRPAPPVRKRTNAKRKRDVRKRTLPKKPKARKRR